MKNPLSLFLAIAAATLFLSCQQKSNKFYMPAEWEHQDAIWLGWEKNPAKGYYPSIVKMVNSIAPKETVKIAFNSDSLLRVARAFLLSEGVDTTNVKFYVMPGDRYWIRDHGAAFLVNANGSLGVADFAWNSYGLPGFFKLKYSNNADSVEHYLTKARDMRLRTAKVDSLMAIAERATILKTDVKHEGGAIEVNGKGTLILCEATVFQRNPDLQREYIESEFMRVLGVSKIIWVKEGLADDPLHGVRRIIGNYVGGGTGGHTDEFVRFANANTILLAWINEDEKDMNPINRMNYDRMKENLTILQNATDQDGKPFTIVKVPLPDLIVRKAIVRNEIGPDEITLDVSPRDFIPSEAPVIGDTILAVPASSYLNYLVTNDLVLLPTYTEMGSSAVKEADVKDIFEKYFPAREIVFINAIKQNWRGGGIHCSTQQQPARIPY